MTLETVLPLNTARPEYDEPLPEWVEELRPQQVDAVREIVECYQEGVQVVILDAPVGSGKTLIGELVPRELGIDRRLYMCSDKALQDQVLRDFPYARVLKGRANYATLQPRGSITCDDCTANKPTDACRFCDPVWDCPYRVAKEAALTARLAVLNTSFFLHATNYAGFFDGNQFTVADECDLLEGALMGFVEFEVPIWIDKKIKMDMPKKGIHKPTLKRWLLEYMDEVSVWLASNGESLEPKQARRMQGFFNEGRQIADYLQRDIELAQDAVADDESGHWVRDYETSTLKLRPVTVSPYGTRRLWRHSDKWLLMSGTVVSSDELVDSLGLPFDYRVVTVPSTFPPENRQVVLAPVANVTRATGESEWPKLAYAIEQICERYPGRVLVHTVSYKLADYLFRECDLGSRPKYTHKDAAGKANALRQYLAVHEAVLFSPSMQRGVDLADDACRVQIICKTPFASLGDKQVSSRLRLPGGQAWYAVKAVRDLVQMTGRGVRSETDWCTTFILDQQFVRNVWGKYSGLFLDSFKEAVKAREDIGWLIRPNGRR